MMERYRLMMLGPPGAGKGTQAKRLAEKFDIPHVSTGDMLRAARRKGTELGEKAAEYMDAGKLVPDEVVIGIVNERLDEDDAARGFILDGFPRTRPQAEALVDRGVNLDAVINIDISDDEVVDRLGGRRSCPECGAVYHIDANPPEQDDVCDSCGHQGLMTRDDDRPEAIRQRLDSYHEKTSPLIEFYEERDVLRNIDGIGSPDEVNATIVSELQGE